MRGPFAALRDERAVHPFRRGNGVKRRGGGGVDPAPGRAPRVTRPYDGHPPHGTRYLQAGAWAWILAAAAAGVTFGVLWVAAVAPAIARWLFERGIG